MYINPHHSNSLYLYNIKEVTMGVSFLYDKFLHKETRLSNKETPISKYVDADKFPEQISELINTVITLKYRNHNIIDVDLSIPSSGRPSDDLPWSDMGGSTGQEEYDPHDVYEEEFLVLRADAAEPYTMIAISLDYNKMIVNSTRPIPGGYKFQEYISELPVEQDEYFGNVVTDIYGFHTEIPATILKMDAGEPCYTILVEFLDSDVIRFVLGDEVLTRIEETTNENQIFTGEKSLLIKNMIEGKVIYGTV